LRAIVSPAFTLRERERESDEEHGAKGESPRQEQAKKRRENQHDSAAGV